MNNIAIKVENLSKAYQLGQIGTGTISRDLERWFARVRGKEDPFLKVGENNDQNTKSESDIVWSLKDINFEIEQGDAVGIIGRNGAGKSTLLKILSKVTAPTTGKITGKGRIASLLEVGTGFHPELSGRENIFLNGAILGMRKKEIERKLEEIVDFAGVERYLDTPVKRYSSGMYVRLAFAVAAHLESEILIVDEVLAVGDAEFQKKCLGKMGQVSKGEGRTVLFVSHNMGSISQLCPKSILLKAGGLTGYSKTSNIIKKYLDNDSNEVKTIENNSKQGNIYSYAAIHSKTGLKQVNFQYDEDINIHIKLHISDYHADLEIALRLVDHLTRAVFTIHEKIGPKKNDNGAYSYKIKIPGNFITPGQYSWVMCINHPGKTMYDLHENTLGFKIEETGSKFSAYNSSDYGIVFPHYQIEKL